VRCFRHARACLHAPGGLIPCWRPSLQPADLWVVGPSNISAAASPASLRRVAVAIRSAASNTASPHGCSRASCCLLRAPCGRRSCRWSPP
jgi:hypothetical protein